VEQAWFRHGPARCLALATGATKPGMVVLLVANVALFLPVFACFVLMMWFGCRTHAGDGSDGDTRGDGGAGERPGGPFSGPGAPSRVVFADRDDLARSA